MSYDSQPPTVPFGPPPPPARRRSRWLVVGGIGAGALALALAVAGGAYAAGVVGDDGPAKIAAAPRVTAPSSAAGPSDDDGQVVVAPGDGQPEVVSNSTLTVIRPATLGGKPRIEIGTGSAATDDLTFQVTATAQGVYGNAAKQDVLFLIAVASTDMTPEARFSLMVSEASQEFGVDHYASVDPGPLGGLAKCGDGTINGVPSAVCAWSDDGTTGLLINSLKDAGDFGKQVAELRTEVEKTSMS